MPDQLTVAGLKRRMDKQLSADDEALEGWLAAAFDQAQAAPPYGCGRLLEPNPADAEDDPVEMRFTPHGSRFVRIPDGRVITDVLADGSPVAYEQLARQGHIVRLELPRPARIVTVTGRFGFATLPENLVDAIYVLAARYFYERAALYADRVVVGEGAVAESYYRQLPPRTKLVFATFTIATDQYGFA